MPREFRRWGLRPKPKDNLIDSLTIITYTCSLSSQNSVEGLVHRAETDCVKWSALERYGHPVFSQHSRYQWPIDKPWVWWGHFKRSFRAWEKLRKHSKPVSRLHVHRQDEPQLRTRRRQLLLQPLPLLWKPWGSQMRRWRHRLLLFIWRKWN